MRYAAVLLAKYDGNEKTTMIKAQVKKGKLKFHSCINTRWNSNLWLKGMIYPPIHHLNLHTLKGPAYPIRSACRIASETPLPTPIWHRDWGASNNILLTFSNLQSHAHCVPFSYVVRKQDENLSLLFTLFTRLFMSPITANAMKERPSSNIHRPRVFKIGFLSFECGWQTRHMFFFYHNPAFEDEQEDLLN